MEERPCVREAECKDCGEDSDLRETDHTMDVYEAETRTEVVCRNCGESGVIVVDEEGTHAVEQVTFKNASWNQVEDDEAE